MTPNVRLALRGWRFSKVQYLIPFSYLGYPQESVYAGNLWRVTDKIDWTAKKQSFCSGWILSGHSNRQ